MARYNTSSSTNTITGAATISSPFQGAFTEFTGSAPYTVTLPTPAAFPGVNQTFYNATGGQVTISTPTGSFTGTGGPNASTFIINSGNVVSVVPDGTNYIVISEDGSPLVATTGSFSGNVTMNGSGATVTITPTTITMNPSGSSSIDNINIGANTRGSGAFNTLTANQAVTFTAGTSSSSSGTGTLVVTGGIGASGNIYSGANIVATNLTGTLQTAAQANVTSVGTLTSLTVSGNSTLGSTGGTVIINETSAESGKLSVKGPNNSLVGTDVTSNTAATFAGTQVGSTANNWGMGILLKPIYARGSAVWLGALNDGTNMEGNPHFAIRLGNYANNTTERLRINSSGNVGIGTTDPQTKLHIGDYTSDVAITLANLNNSSSRINFYDQNNTEGTYLKATGESTGGTITFGARWDDDEDKMVLKMYQVSAGGNYHIRAGIGNTAPEGTLHVTASAITAAAPSQGWPNYTIPDQDTNTRIVGIFDTAGNGSVATAGYGPTVVLRLGSYYDSRAVISPYGAGGASPSDQSTGAGKDLMVKGGQSDNTNGKPGGRLYLNGGAGYTSGSGFGARGYEGQVRIQNQGGNTFIGAAISNTSSAGNNMLYLPFQYNDGGEYAPQRASGMLHIGSFTHRDGSRYLDIKLNQGASMFMFHIYGYLYNSANINTWIGGYSYTGNSILNLYTQNLGNCSATVYRTATNNYLCVKIDRGNSGYSEGKVNVFYHAWSQGEMEGMAVTSYAQNNTAGNYYTS
jgi:hypothetical protein